MLNKYCFSRKWKNNVCGYFKKGEYYIIVINNDGKKPTEDIVERGGLSSLRILVEKTGGKMTIESKPIFKLILELKESQKI